ncbi:MAG TPA: HAMP domain-containing sensor histidine kinase [Bacteroidales bacterium]
MVQTLGFHKYFEKEMSLFYYILSLLGIIGNLIDIFTLYLKNPNFEFYLNLLAIGLLSLSCLFYNRKVISLKAGFAFALYTIFGNMLLSNYGFVHEKFHEFYILRQAIFTGFLITAAFLFINRVHGFSIGILYLIYYSYAVYDSGSEFLITNLYIIFVVFICYMLTLYFFNTIINRSVRKIQDDGVTIKEQNEQLTEINDELMESQRQINAQHEELITLSESLYTQNQELEDKNLKLEEAIQQKTKFFSIVAHDLKSPFLSIISLHEQMLENYEAMSEEKKKCWLDTSLVSTKLLYELLENLLMWSRSQIGMLKLNPCLIDVNDTIDKIFNIYKNYSSSKSIQLEKQVEEGLSVFADYMMFETILRNLTSNAIKYSFAKGTVKITAEKANHYTLFSVIDSGLGIDKQRQQALFSLDNKSTTLGTSGEKGTGLGLRICKEFIEKHNGKIRIESEAGKGTIVNFSLPAGIPD